jgi:hypothetical protein
LPAPHGTVNGRINGFDLTTRAFARVHVVHAALAAPGFKPNHTPDEMRLRMPRVEEELVERPSTDDDATFELTTVRIEEIPDGGAVFWATEVGGTTRHFNGQWVDEHHLEHVYDGDVYVRVTALDADHVDAEILLAHDGKLRSGGRWTQLGAEWAETLLDPVETLMAVHLDLEEGVRCKQFVPGDDVHGA